jgi:hypothetical protein
MELPAFEGGAQFFFNRSVIAVQNGKLSSKGRVRVDGFPRDEGGHTFKNSVVFSNGGDVGRDGSFQVAVEGDGLDSTVFVQVGKGKDAVFKGRVFGLKGMKAWFSQFVFYLSKVKRRAVFIGLPDSEVGVLGKGFQVNDDV